MVLKNSPDPTGAENPATPPGEGVLSSDLDKIPTEGQAGPLNRPCCPHLPAKDLPLESGGVWEPGVPGFSSQLWIGVDA